MRIISEDLLGEVAGRLAAEFSPEEVWLFGSYAWGQPDDGSDIDLLVVVPESNEPPIHRAQRGHRCLAGLGLAKDVLVKTRAEVERFRRVPASLEAEILLRGRKIYG
jgi:predicted nucleotidyltransferase